MHDRYDPQLARRNAPLGRHDQNVIDVYRPEYAGYGPHADHLEEDGFDFWETVRVLLRRKWMIMSVTLLGIMAAVLLTLNMTPLFKATTTLEIQRQETQILDQSSIDPVMIADAEYMETQYALLQSRSLAERVAEVLNLPSDERYADQTLNRDERLNEAASMILDNLRVNPEGRSRVVNVEFVSPYPREAARIANTLVENFIETNLERKYNTTAYARRFLAERLQTTKLALEESERELAEYAYDQGILELDVANGGGSLDANSLIQLNQELAEAESDRIELEQKLTEIENNPATREILDSRDLQLLRQRRSQLQSEYQEMLGQFKPGYPAMEQMRSRIALLDQEMALTQQAILAAIRSEYNSAFAKEEALRVRVDELKSELQALRDRKIRYTILGREVDTNRSQYEALLQRMKEVSVASGIGSSQVSIVDRALVPRDPFEPNLLRTLVQAFVLSFAAGVGLAFALNYIDDTIKTPEDVKSKLGLATIGVVPKLKGGKDLITNELGNPRSPISEAFFSARTSLDFTTENGAPRSLLMTSTRPGEGKTSSTVALAMSFAKVGRRVLIIDADMRKPSFVADAGASIGLSGMLTRDTNLSEQVVRSGTENLFLLPAGIIPPNPAELLSSPKLRSVLDEAMNLFDLVVVDSPPVLSFTDAPLLGSIAEGSVIVVQAGSIRTPAVQRTISRMLESRTNVLGVMLTKFDAKKSGSNYSYYGYAYGKNAYSYSEKQVSDSSETRRKIRIFSEAASDTASNSEREA